MIRHIVIFKLKPAMSAQEKKSVMTAFKSDIEALPAVINCIRNIRVGLNVHADEVCDICLESVFDTLDDVRAYSVHPAHRAVAGRLAPYIEVRSCVDYEI